MFRASWACILVSLLVPSAWAEPRPKITSSKPSPVPNLIDESTRLRVLEERSIQQDVSRARLKYGLGYGVMSAKKLEILSYERRVRYNDVSRPGISGNLGYFPIPFFGFFGVIGSIGYNYGENSGLVKTSLHWVAADLALAYRYEASEQALFKPFVSFGGGYNMLIQRGPSYYNTSEARGMGIASLGLALNLNRTFGFRAPLMYELTAQYRKVIDSEDRDLNFNGEQYALGMELAL